MTMYMVTYDKNAGDDYSRLHKALESYPAYWHCVESTWLIITNDSAASIRDNLNKTLDEGDKLLVVKVVKPGAWTGFNKECSDWLMKNIPAS